MPEVRHTILKTYITCSAAFNADKQKNNEYENEPFFLLTDFYKVGHIFQYPGAPRWCTVTLHHAKSRIPGADEMVFSGCNYLSGNILNKIFLMKTFSSSLRRRVLTDYKREELKTSPRPLTYRHIEELHELGYLPMK